MTTLPDLAPPATAAAQAALRVTRQYAAPSLLNHAYRSWLWARSYAVHRDLAHDGELLYVAALLHDLGLEPAFDNASSAFEEAGGHVAWVFGAAAGWSAARCSRTAEVIVRHMGDDVDPHDDPESFLLQRGTSMDISGTGLQDWPAPLRQAILAAVPRLTLAADFTRCFAEQARRKPRTAAAAAMRSGIADRLRANPLEGEPVRAQPPPVP